MNNSKGFTLIELMMVVGIVGILVAISYPSYVEHVNKGSRAEAMSSLLDIANRQEQFYADNHKYTSTLSDLGIGSLTASSLYSITLTSDGMTFSAVATPVKAPANQDQGCTSFTITDLGTTSATGNAGTDRCWGR